MEHLTDDNPYKKQLVDLMNYFFKEYEMEIEEFVLVLLILDTEPKIKKFLEWAQSKFDGEKYQLDKRLINRAASGIAFDRNDLL